jgi:hypothetical protein
MTESMLPDLVAHLLSSAPVTRKKLLELRLRWDDLPPGRTRMAEALRVFVLTWDPLELNSPRPPAVATANADPLEVVVYVPRWSLMSGPEPAVSVLGTLGGTAVATAAAYADDVVSGRYPALAAAREAPDLLSGPASGLSGPASGLGDPAEIRAVTGRWEDIGLGVITDIVQQAHGPVDLDRSLVELSPVPVPKPGCPACAGKRFGFIADLVESQELMCAPHRREAERVRRARFARAQSSNPVGWQAIIDASTRLSQPHLPDGLATQLGYAGAGLASRAGLLAEAARWFPGRPYDFARALGQENDLPGWLLSLVRQLGQAGLGAEAVTAAEALTKIAPSRAAHFAADTAVALAEAGLADEVRAKVEDNLARWPEDFGVRLSAGDALDLLRDRDGALAHFEAAQEMARAFKDRRDAAERIRRLTRPEAGPSPTVVRNQRTTRKTKRKT